MSAKPTYEDLAAWSDDNFRVADHSDRTTVMAGYSSASRAGRGKSSARCAVLSTRTLTGRFSLKYYWFPLPRSFFERGIMNKFRRNSARILASRKECYGQKNRSAQ